MWLNNITDRMKMDLRRLLLAALNRAEWRIGHFADNPQSKDGSTQENTKQTIMADLVEQMRPNLHL